jgi:HD-like signal output (HDOD) protein
MTFARMPQDVAGWVRALDAAQIPVLQRTADELARLRENEEHIVARDIARVLLHDPMFTLLVLRYLEAHRGAAQITDITTVEHALMMLGVTPFFEHFDALPAVESLLVDQPRALDGLMHVINRAHHAALYAHDWAVLRHDPRADEVAIAALLHDLAEMLLWSFAPELQLRMTSILQADRSLRSSAVQKRVLRFSFSGLQSALIAEWKLASMLQTLMNDSGANDSRTLNVTLAVNLARHSEDGWSNPALLSDYAAITQYLKLPRQEVLARIRREALQADSGADWYHLETAATSQRMEGASNQIQDCANSDDS